MSSPEDVVAALPLAAAVLRARHCSRCAGWPAISVIHGDGFFPHDAFGVWVSDDDPTEPCSRCGRRPRVLRVEYVDNWRNDAGQKR